MKVVVTGATGFIGGRLASELAKRGHDVVATGRKSCPDSLKALSLTYIPCSLNNENEIDELLSGAGAIFHCAGLTGVWGPYRDYYEANVLLTERLLSAAKKSGVQRFIHLSSPSLYFQYCDQHDLREEDVPRKFSNAYAETKYLSEKLVLKENSPNFLTLCFRPRGVIGAGDTSWLPRIIELYECGRLIIPGSGANKVDFTSCQNLVVLMANCLDATSEVFGDTYNVTNGEPVALWDFVPEALKELGVWQEERPLKSLPLFLVMALAKVSALFSKIFFVKREPKILPLKVGVAAYSMTLNIDKARQELAYNPGQSNSEALKEFVAWWQERSS